MASIPPLLASPAILPPFVGADPGVPSGRSPYRIRDGAMSRILRKSYLQGDLAAARSLLSSLPAGDTHMLDRMGIESRIRDIQDQLSALEGDVGVTGEMVLFFYGAPVKEEHGIDARFSAEVLGAYQDLVSKQVAAHQGPLGRSGPTRAEKESRLHITNVVHGSFGFELEELVDAETRPLSPARSKM
jgi:hypothetical protein